LHNLSESELCNARCGSDQNRVEQHRQAERFGLAPEWVERQLAQVDVLDVGGDDHATRAERHGALIVIERATGLQDYTETGVPVNGRLSAELLASIFMVRSPLHDGAVIVRGSQILAAACLLPLEDTQDRASHRYGMRHRAALSISSQTDAIVIVVSEETQAISIASSGRIIGGLDEERLRRLVLDRLPYRAVVHADHLQRLHALAGVDHEGGPAVRSRIQPLPFRSKAS